MRCENPTSITTVCPREAVFQLRWSDSLNGSLRRVYCTGCKERRLWDLQNNPAVDPSSIKTISIAESEAATVPPAPKQPVKPIPKGFFDACRMAADHHARVAALEPLIADLYLYHSEQTKLGSKPVPAQFHRDIAQKLAEFLPDVKKVRE